MTIDTLAISRRLQGVGVDPKQADEFADIMRETAVADLANLATKADLTAIKAEIAAVRTDLSPLATKDDLAAVKAELKAETAAVAAGVFLLKWMLGLLIAGVASLVLKAFG